MKYTISWSMDGIRRVEEVYNRREARERANEIAQNLGVSVDVLEKMQHRYGDKVIDRWIVNP